MSRSIEIFDLDDTLLGTPTLSDFVNTNTENVVDVPEAIIEPVVPLLPNQKKPKKEKIVDASANAPAYLRKIKNYIYILFSKEIYFVRQGDFVLVYDAKTKQPLGSDFYAFIQDLTPEKIESAQLKASSLKEILKAFKLHNGHLVIESFPGFHEDPKTIGKYANKQVIEDYNNATNKMILTGRGEPLRSNIEQRLQELGVEKPNYGLFLYPGGSTGVQQFKVNTILDSIEKNNWEEVHFYEDRKEWLEAAKNAVESAYPNVRFIPHFITNIKASLSL